MVRRSARIAQSGRVEKASVEKKSVKKEARKKAPAKKVVAKEEDNEVEEKKENLSNSIEIGDSIPEITLKDQDDEEIDISKIISSNRIVAIFAYPKASTPGCTVQACGYSANYDSLKGKAKIYGLSSDSPKSQKNFMTKQQLKLDGLLCDPEKILIGPLGAKKSPNGIKRSHWIFVDGKLKVKHVQISPKDSIAQGKKEIEEIYDSLK